jgi:hypothetical protein
MVALGLVLGGGEDGLIRWVSPVLMVVVRLRESEWPGTLSRTGSATCP